MNAHASILERYDDELAEHSFRRSNFQKTRLPKTSRARSRRRKSPVNKIGCGFGARRNKRWAW